MARTPKKDKSGTVYNHLESTVMGLIEEVYDKLQVREVVRKMVDDYVEQTMHQEVAAAVEKVKTQWASALNVSLPSKSEKRERGPRGPYKPRASKESRETGEPREARGERPGFKRNHDKAGNRAYGPNSGPGKIEALLREKGPMTAVQIARVIYPNLDPEREGRRRTSIAVSNIVGLKKDGTLKERIYSV